MQVRAKQMCFIDGARHREGAVFEFKGKDLPSWLEPVGNAAEQKPEEESVSIIDYDVMAPPKGRRKQTIGE